MALIRKSNVAKLDSQWHSSPQEILRLQLAQLNEQWTIASREIPYYRRLREQRNFPQTFTSIDQYVEHVPVLQKAELQRAPGEFSHATPPTNTSRITGGSTGTPIQMPAWRSEFNHTKNDPWLGRYWHQVMPNDRLFLYWGHAHLLGTGWRRPINGVLRRLKDAIQGYCRHSCYDMSPPALRSAAKAIIKTRPRFIIGYSACLDRLARHNADMKEELHNIGTKAVIGAAEAFPFEDSVSLVEDVFGCGVGMEYGSVETNLIAHTHPDGNYRVFWWNYLLEHHGGPDAQEVYVTSLYPRCTPLFRYQLGDQYSPGSSLRTAGKFSVVEFDAVVGRSNLPVILPNGRQLHSEAITHIVRHSSKIEAYQFVCGGNDVELRIIEREPLGDTERQDILAKACQVDEDLGAAMRITAVPELDRSVAGKTPMIVYRDRLSSPPATPTLSDA